MTVTMIISCSVLCFLKFTKSKKFLLKPWQRRRFGLRGRRGQPSLQRFHGLLPLALFTRRISFHGTHFSFSYFSVRVNTLRSEHLLFTDTYMKISVQKIQLTIRQLTIMKLCKVRNHHISTTTFKRYCDLDFERGQLEFIKLLTDNCTCSNSKTIQIFLFIKVISSFPNK